MNENRRKILEMLAAGQITADEAERLLTALEQEQPPSSSGEPKAKAKYLRVLVEENKDGGTNPTKVNIRVPMQFLRAGVRLASLIPSQAREHVNSALRKEGVNFDVSDLKPENLEELVDQLNELTIDIDDKNKKAKVMIFCE
jgi:Asp-tRNA(Asn)/Glu-tRNA(Gln) amidotransferase B subunit